MSPHGSGGHGSPVEQAELSSISTALEEMAARLAAMGDRCVSEQREEVASELFQAESALAATARRLRRIPGSRS